MKRLEVSGSGTQLWWPTYAWILAGVEVLVVLWFHVSRVPAEVSLDGYLWQFAVLFGSDEQRLGVFPVIHAVNTLVVVGLWVTYRSMRRFGKARASPAFLAPVLAAFLFALVGWWGARLQSQYRPVETRAVYRLEPNETYTLTVLDDRCELAEPGRRRRRHRAAVHSADEPWTQPSSLAPLRVAPVGSRASGCLRARGF